MNEAPLVSIIIPFYNEEKYLNKCLYSIKDQIYKNMEVILVDDGSNDKSLEIAKKYKFKILHQKHEGPGVARNKGAKLARGRILCFLDADMKYPANYVNNLIDPILKDEKTIGTFSYEKVANKDNIWSTCFSINSDLLPGERTSEKKTKESDIFRAILDTEFRKIGGFDPALGYADDKSISRALGKKSVLAEGAISYHYNPESLSEVFKTSRWIGKSIYFKRNLITILRLSIVNSVRNSLVKIVKGAPVRFLLFKIVYDFGLLSGVFFKGGSNAK